MKMTCAWLDQSTQQVSESLGRQWYPLSDRQLPPAVLHSEEDAERAYMAVLLKDQNPFQDLNNNTCRSCILRVIDNDST